MALLDTLALSPARSRRSVFTRLIRAYALYRERRALAALDTAQLHDIGITRGAAHREASRPVWDVPQHWHNNVL